VTQNGIKEAWWPCRERHLGFMLNAMGG